MTLFSSYSLFYDARRYLDQRFPGNWIASGISLTLFPDQFAHRIPIHSVISYGAFKISPLWNVSRQCVEIRRQPDDQSCRQIRVSCSNKFDDLPCDAFTLLAKLDLVTWSNFSKGSYATIATQSKLLLENEGHTGIRLREIFFLV